VPKAKAPPLTGFAGDGFSHLERLPERDDNCDRRVT
jgi:hypothetical protein